MARKKNAMVQDFIQAVTNASDSLEFYLDTARSPTTKVEGSSEELKELQLLLYRLARDTLDTAVRMGVVIRTAEAEERIRDPETSLQK